MSDPSKENLREISHLFLSSVRDRATGGAPRPQRIPPGGQQSPPPPRSMAESIDMTAEEFALAFETAGDDEPAAEADRGKAPVPEVVAIIGAHLNGKQFDRAKEYARHLAATGLRVGLLEVDASEFRVMCFDRYSGDAPDGDAGAADPAAECSFDPRRMNEVLDELSWDVQRWVLVLPQVRVPEARGLLRECTRWVLLSTCDHDGVISCYRTLKGLTDLWPGGATPDKPALSLALLDVADSEQAERVSAKLVSVCQQFLNWPIESEQPVGAGGERVAEHLVMRARPTRDKGQLGTAPQWQIVADLIARSKATPAVVAAPPVDEPVEAMDCEPMEAGAMHAAEEELHETRARSFGAAADTATVGAGAGDAEASKLPPTNARHFEPVMRSIPMPHQNESAPSYLRAAGTSPAIAGDTADVIDLPFAEGGDAAIIDAILRHCSNELVECPVAPPMCPQARLAVGRDRRVVMLAVAQHGLSDLNTIGRAYKWLHENQNLIGMAVPQLAIDTTQAPHLSLLIDQADTAAHTLQPMLQGDHVTVKTYRKLRWGGKTGLLLEAA